MQTCSIQVIIRCIELLIHRNKDRSFLRGLRQLNRVISLWGKWSLQNAWNRRKRPVQSQISSELTLKSPRKDSRREWGSVRKRLLSLTLGLSRLQQLTEQDRYFHLCYVTQTSSRVPLLGYISCNAAHTLRPPHSSVLDDKQFCENYIGINWKHPSAMYIIKNYYYISIYQHGKISSVTLYQKVDLYSN